MMQNEDQHLAGFNDGYTIQKYEPELANQMLSNLDGVEEPYMKGFVAGAKEYQLEKELEQTPLFPGIDDHYTDLSSDPSIEKDKEDKDFDLEM